MSHNLEQINDHEISALTIRPRKYSRKGNPSGPLAPTEIRVTKLGGVGGGHHQGIKLKLRRVDGGAPGPVDIKGEDLFALREFLAELPEEAFVRPADPVEKPERWNEGDILEELYQGGTKRRIWSRYAEGWRAVDAVGTYPDAHMESGLNRTLGSGNGWILTVIRQASGQDL